MNNIYLITLKEYDYDEYDAFVVIAKDKEEAFKLCKIEEKPRRFSENQTFNNIKSTEIIGTTNKKPELVLGSFNAG